MFRDLVRCERCHRRYPEPFGHKCPQESFAAQREQTFEAELAAWLETAEGRFAEFLARRQREG
jgi:hypothetical protein